MDKIEIRNHLLVGNHEWGFYAKEERIGGFTELLKDGFPMAVEIYFKAPWKFVGDEFRTFQESCFPDVIALYQAIRYQNGEIVEKKKTESNQLNKYKELFETIKITGPESQIMDSLEKKIWSKCTEDLLVICKRYHNSVISDKGIANDQKSIHKNCIKKIENRVTELRNWRNDAENYFYQNEQRYIYNILTSNQIDDNTLKKIKRMLESHAKDVFQEVFWDRLQREYKIIAWVEVYIDAFSSFSDKGQFEEMASRVINSSLVGQIDSSYVGRVFMKMNTQQQEKLLNGIGDRKVHLILLKYYSERTNKPDEVQKLLQQYMERYPESGEAICDVIDLAGNERLIINSLPELVEKYVKRWLINYNYHNRENEIASVIEALDSVKKIESLFFDFAFWKETEKCNAFIRVIENIALSIGFEKCYRMIEQNYLAAKAYGMVGLMSKWLQVANSLAINNEDAYAAYVFFISNLIDSESALDTRSKDKLIKETIDYMLKQASSNKKIAELEKAKLAMVKKEVIGEIIQKIYNPIERMEKMVTAYTDPSASNAEAMKFMRDMVGKVRLGLQLAGIMPVEDVDNWIKQRSIPYNPAKQVCHEEAQPGELVTCLSIGMMDVGRDYYEKATVKKYVGEVQDGNNI